MENVWKGVFAAAMTALSAYAQQVVIPVCVLVAAMATDYITGITAAWVTKELNSKTGFIGIVKKVAKMALIAVGMFMDYLLSEGVAAFGAEMPFAMPFGLLVIFWLIVDELISIVENCDELGLPVPGFLTKALKDAKKNTDIQEEQK